MVCLFVLWMFNLLFWLNFVLKTKWKPKRHLEISVSVKTVKTVLKRFKASMKGFKKEWKISLEPRRNLFWCYHWELEKVKNNVLPKTTILLDVAKLVSKTPRFYKLKIVHQFSTIKLGLEIKHKCFSNIKLAALKRF